MGEGQSFQQMVLGKLDIYKEKNEGGCLSYIIYKNELKVDQRAKTIKLIEKKLGGQAHDFGSDYDLLSVSPKAKATKKK